MQRFHGRPFTSDIPVLSIHDSFFVPYDHVLRLRALMGDAAVAVVGVDLPVEANAFGLDGLPSEFTPGYVQSRQTPLCSGYLRRLEAHEERYGPLRERD